VHHVPHLTREYIERKAEKVLGWANKRLLTEPSLTPLAPIVERLAKKGRVGIVLDKSLGVSARGRRVFGAFLFEPPTILVDRNLDPNGPRFRFTLAHELGHLVLHGHLKLRFDDIDTEIRDGRPHFFFGRKQPSTDRDWLEWQANAFASALLIPRPTVGIAIKVKQAELGITRNRGTIYVDRQWQNRLDYKALMEHLCKVYQASHSMMRIRLTTLGRLHDERDFALTHIGHHFKALFREDEAAEVVADDSVVEQPPVA
jgi:Zn-dependent peptidase ImmA (M78 family)